MTKQEADKEAHIQEALYRVADQEYVKARDNARHRLMEWMKALQKRREAER